MCDVRHGHDYRKDVEEEMGNGNGDKWSRGLRQWLSEHWLLGVILVTLVAWVIRVEVFAQAGGRFTSSDAHEMEQRWEERFDALPPDTYEKYIDSRFDSLEAQIQTLHDDVLWIREQLDE